MHLEGFTLQRSKSSNSGFVGVTRVSAAKHASRPFRASADKTFDQKYLGHYETAEAAALVVAKHAATGELPEKGPPRPSHKVVFEEPPADFVAEAEGFQLEFCPHSKSGYKGVCKRSPHKQFNYKRPWTAFWTTVGCPQTFIGNFATKVEAAVAVARYRASGEKPPALNDRWPLPPPAPSGVVTEAEVHDRQTCPQALSTDADAARCDAGLHVAARKQHQRLQRGLCVSHQQAEPVQSQRRISGQPPTGAPRSLPNGRRGGSGCSAPRRHG